jgi:hypothetical protein
MALDLFKLLCESNMGTGGLMDGKVEDLWVNKGQAVFCSSFCHSGGSNYSIDQTMYVYCLFAYIVSSESDYILPKLEQGSNIEAQRIRLKFLVNVKA